MSSVHVPSRAPRRIAFAAASLALVVPLAVPRFASAQARLDPVVVTATREPQPLSRSIGDLVVIDTETIRNSGADSVEDLLRRQAGLQLARNGGPGQPAGYFLRGAGTSSTLILVDGVRIGSATLGQVDLESLGLAQIERIEVLRGPASSLYGADGVGGVVQIFTRRGAGSPRLTGHVAAGGYRSRQADLGVSGSVAAFDYAADASRETSRGVSTLRPGDAFGSYNPDRDGFRRHTGNLRLGWTPAAGHRFGLNVVETRLRSEYDAAEFAPPDFDADPSPDFVNRLKTRVHTLDYRGEPTRTWTTSVQLARHVDDSTSGGETTSRFVTHREQGTWQNALRIGTDQQLVLAYEHLREKAGGETFPGEPQRHNHGFVLGYSGRLGAHGVQADLRRDENSVYGGRSTGRVGYAFEVIPGLKLRALAGTTFRAPTFNDLYFPGYGVDTVEPERGRSVEVGIAWQLGGSSASATVYRNRVRNLIAYQPDRDLCPPDPAYDFGCADNVGRARLQGATIAAAQRWGGLDLRATVDFLDAIDRDTGQRLPRRAAHQETLAVDYGAGAWTVGGSMLRIGSRPDGGETLGGYSVFDLRASWRFASLWRVEAKLLNAFDHRVEPVRDYRGLGRQAWLGLRFDSGGI